MPSTTSLWELHQMIQVAMRWDNEHLHVFVKGWEEYGGNAKSEYDVTLASLLPKAGGWLAYRYDFGDVRHEALIDRVGVRDLCRWVVAATRLKMRAT
ncbi:IS1096 element passenger TnpR family protein [Streptosporangium sp. CA-135522]|uniref:IS1096 element passenger TnpR family protein n=1 Tax=Streptosporangium sp. CA-135522 TaxID=3240072 RepID=UPI003D90D6A0